MTGWPHPWHAPTEQDRQTLKTRLQEEVGAGHVLKGRSARLLARRLDKDDALFSLDDGQIAEVHLTWNEVPQLNPQYPRTVIFRSLGEWRETWREIH